MKKMSVPVLALLCALLMGCATPLTTAVEKRDIREVNRLLDAGAKINEPGGDPARTPLALAIHYRYFDIAKHLIGRGADVNVGFPLHWAIDVGDISMVNLLLDKGADVNHGYYGFGSPLMVAAQGGKTAIVERLLEKGAELDGALATCTKYNSTFGLRGDYEPCVAMLNSIKAKRAAPVQVQPAAARPGVSVSKEEIASMVQAAVERTQKTQDRKEETARAADDIAHPSIAPAARIMGDNDLSVIIGIEGYQNLPKSDYSYDDAKLVKEYVKALGFQERNIELLLDERATLSAISKSVEAWLRNKSKPNSRVFVYYSGHGAPDPQTGEAYLMPYDGDPNYLSNTGYSLKRLYDYLGRLRVREVVVVLDACFSGAGGRSVIAKGTRPLVMITEKFNIPPHMAILTATQGTQISTSHPDKGHGVFTYYFLKAIKDNQKNLAEIYRYVTPLVEDEAKGLNVQQRPCITPTPSEIGNRFTLRK